MSVIWKKCVYFWSLLNFFNCGQILAYGILIIWFELLEEWINDIVHIQVCYLLWYIMQFHWNQRLHQQVMVILVEEVLHYVTCGQQKSPRFEWNIVMHFSHYNSDISITFIAKLPSYSAFKWYQNHLCICIFVWDTPILLLWPLK